MADEEILEETPKPKAEGGGGIKFTHLIIIAVALIIVTALSTMMVTKKIGGIFTTVQKGLEEIKDRDKADMAMREGLSVIEECKRTADLTYDEEAKKSTPITVNLTDGESYLRTFISLCLDPKIDLKTEGNIYAESRAGILHVTNEYLSGLSKADFFSGLLSGKPAKSTGAIVSEKANAAEEDFWVKETHKSSTVDKKTIGRVRGELLQIYQMRGFPFIKDVFIIEFLIQ